MDSNTDQTNEQPSTSTDISNSTLESQRFLDFENFAKFYETFTGKIKETVTSSAKIPLKESDLEYFSTIPSFNTFMKTQNERVLKLIGQILKQQNIKKSNIHSKKLEDEERMDVLIDINDQIIEKLGIQLDEIQGLRKKTETELKLSVTTLNATSRNINTSWNKDMGMVVNKTLAQNLYTSNSKSQSGSSVIGNQFSHRKGVLQKPQQFFNDKIDNSNLAFLPKIREKPNALKPLSEIFSKLDEPSFKVTQELFDQNLELLENPYLYEIEQLKLNEEDFRTINESIPEPLSLEKANYKYIDSLNDLIWLCDYLGKNNRSKIKEIAVDLEHHSFRSFLGFTCLMQISTREDDFLIDTLKLRHEMHRLNEIFTDWTLLKILHGSDFDIEWLQKDFGIYVVNMFDTGQAARTLQYPYYSLSYLLQRFCNITAQKQYQLDDWRKRPLDDGMIRYAREDTRYLLYIYDLLKNELIKQFNRNENQIFSQSNLALVFEKSKMICKKVYKKPMFFSKGFMTLCQNNSHLNPKQMKALHDLYRWRDRIARETDESCEYVLKNHQLLKIAELLPREIYGIMALCNPISSIIETNVHEIHDIIKTAREYIGTHGSFEFNEPDKNQNSLFNKEENKDQTKQSNALDSIVHSITFDSNSILNCPHDFPHNSETRNSNMEVDEQQLSDANAFEKAFKSNLVDLLIKPKDDYNLVLPNNFSHTKESSMKEFFDKNIQIKTSNTKKKAKEVDDKIRKIKESIKNPFELFLPKEFRLNKVTVESSESSIWNLLKPSFQQNAIKEMVIDSQVKVEETQSESFMIPLKNQFKLERNKDKKFKKKLKNVDFSEMLTQYNKSKVENTYALGADEENGEELARISENVENSLKSISELVKKTKFPNKEDSKTVQEVYDPANLNQMFAKPVKQENKDIKSRRIDGKFGKVNKRRATNAVTRNKHNKSHTFKTS